MLLIAAYPGRFRTSVIGENGVGMVSLPPLARYPYKITLLALCHWQDVMSRLFGMIWEDQAMVDKIVLNALAALRAQVRAELEAQADAMMDAHIRAHPGAFAQTIADMDEEVGTGQ